MKKEVNDTIIFNTQGDYNEFIKFVDGKLTTMAEKEYRPATYNKNELEEWRKKVEEAEIYFEFNGCEKYGQDYWDFLGTN